MPLKKQHFDDDEVPIFDDALIYKRGGYWQFRMWLTKERKYARFTLKTRNKSTALEKAKLHYHELMAGQLAGKRYHSISTKDGVEKYVKQRQKEVDAGRIVSGRLGTIRTHLEHWLDFIKRDTKLRELGRNDCENYFSERTKTKRNIAISRTTVMNEQSTINAMMAWLFKNNETLIDGFDFPKQRKTDKSDPANRRSTFTREEIADIGIALEKKIAEAHKNLDEGRNLTKLVVCYYLLVAIMSGLRTGEQRLLKWKDVKFIRHRDDRGNTYDLVSINVRTETSKVRKSREFFIRDNEYFEQLSKVLWPRYANKKVGDYLVFSTNGTSLLTQRSILYHFHNVLEECEIKHRDKRDLVPYSFRHYFITDKVKAGLTYRQVADMCGTSVTQIENTYRHIDRETMLTNALADYYIDGTGRVIPRTAPGWSGETEDE